MRRIIFWAGILLAAVVVFNVCTRETGPVIHAGILFPFLEGHGIVGGLVALLLKPGACALWYLGLSLTTRSELIVAALLSWWVYLIALRFIKRALFLE